jgi:hypothetical protein
MRFKVFLGPVLGVLVLYAGAVALEQQKEQKAAGLKTITGTIAKQPSAMITFESEANKPARFHGIVFVLKEYPGKSFTFRSRSFKHDGQSLLEDLTGRKVELACKSAGGKEYEVINLKWLDAPKPAKKK